MNTFIDGFLSLIKQINLILRDGQKSKWQITLDTTLFLIIK